MIDSKMIGFHNHVLAPKCWKTYCLNPPAAPESSLRNTRYTGLNLTGPDGVIVFRGRLPAGNITDIATAHGNFRPEKAPCVTAMSALRMTPTLNPFLNPVPPGLLPSVFTSTRLLPSSAPCLLLLPVRSLFSSVLLFRSSSRWGRHHGACWPFTQSGRQPRIKYRCG